MNRTLLASLAILAIAISLVHLSGKGGCSARIVLGKECVLCGMTRDFFGLLRGNFSFRNPLSPFLFALTVFELAWRCLFSFKLASGKTMLADAILHSVLLVAVFTANFVKLFC